MVAALSEEWESCRGGSSNDTRREPADMTPSIKTIILTSLMLLLLASCATSRQPATPAGEEPGKQLYDSGRAALLKRNYAQAIDRFRTLAALHPDSTFTRQARMELAYSYYKSGDALSAIAAAERFIRDYPHHPTVDYLYYLRGLAAYDQSIAFLEQQAEAENPASPPLAQLALQYFNNLIEHFPASKYSEDASARLTHLQSGLVRLEILRAKRALARGDYAIAALHARAIMEKYPDSAHTREAVALADMARRALQPAAVAAAVPAPLGDAGGADSTPPTADDQPPAHGGITAQAAMPNKEEPGAEASPIERTSDNGPHKENWLMAQTPTAFTLQLLGTSKRQALLAFMGRHELQGQAAYFTSEHAGQPWYTLVYGIYQDRASAQAALATLPSALRSLHPWIRSLSSIQASIRATQAATGP